MEVVCHSLGELKKLADGLAGYLPPDSVLLLDGDLGSGKTALVKLIAEGLGITEIISSPTFTLINEYYSGRLPLYHADLYRLEKPNHIEELHLELYWQGREFLSGIVAIEWAEKLPKSVPLPLHHYHIHLRILADESRLITLENFPPELFSEIFPQWS
jgi:tRNA threonylcarbamoyladenosine biosynthesis protein TsaE